MNPQTIKAITTSVQATGVGRAVFVHSVGTLPEWVANAVVIGAEDCTIHEEGADVQLGPVLGVHVMGAIVPPLSVSTKIELDLSVANLHNVVFFNNYIRSQLLSQSVDLLSPAMVTFLVAEGVSPSEWEVRAHLIRQALDKPLAPAVGQEFSTAKAVVADAVEAVRSTLGVPDVTASVHGAIGDAIGQVTRRSPGRPRKADEVIVSAATKSLTLEEKRDKRRAQQALLMRQRRAKSRDHENVND